MTAFLPHCRQEDIQDDHQAAQRRHDVHLHVRAAGQPLRLPYPDGENQQARLCSAHSNAIATQQQALDGGCAFNGLTSWLGCADMILWVDCKTWSGLWTTVLLKVLLSC